MPQKNINLNIHQANWPVHNVLAFTTTRHHPSLSSRASSEQTAYLSFNLGNHVGDNAKSVSANQKCLMQLLPKKSNIQWFEQVHGNDVAVINTHTDKAVIADAAVTKHRHIALAIMTADCLPILLSTKQGNEIAAIHGGWRPLAGNIIAKTLAKMTADNNDIVAWLGPCIGESAFEVGEEVKQQFLQQSLIFQSAFKPQVSDIVIGTPAEKPTYLANLQLIAMLQLQQLGITNISILPHCTFTRESEYYSYRRDKVTGRMATVICRT